MSAPRFDELIHAPTRLALVSLLAAIDWAEFRYLREQLGLSDSALSKQLSILEQAGYVEVRKSFVGKRPRTSIKLSRRGRGAFDGHVAALQQIVAQAGASVLPGT
ncbi:winged helix DNA-binding protein [Micromonospora kangleipakensis]|uniref:Winged helix DNA-binding protein n=1 Tax=Micromonospora kangleipakensis TaxID=1077942 RepID=A0A4Q8BHS0_9ACTN|nr:transcriptional regulator [Micromonospora kangleipakensis]RZU77594.1 winged helix DNA-binding protein [Micromonospora kangleipakensis]